ncbi:MAG: hypothetical protein KDK06_06925 [Gammaproteobacteria bacterium]|nr:hypothetical protein [Gammaproteobacteria bacterium]
MNRASVIPLSTTALLGALAPGFVQAAAILPDFASAVFTPGQAIDNPYFHLVDGLTRIYEGSYEEGGETITERFELTLAGAGPTLLGVQTTTRLDRAYEDDVLVEETFDYYAQDTAGNVWYFGEDVVNYRYDDDGNFLGTDSASAWLSGSNSALPGFAMPASLVPGFNYYQEFAPFDGALDEGQTLAGDRTVALESGAIYDDVLAVLEFSVAAPDTYEIKYYAPGAGLIAVDEDFDLELGEAGFRVELIGAAAPVPLPAPALLLGSAMAAVFANARRRASA